MKYVVCLLAVTAIFGQSKLDMTRGATPANPSGSVTRLHVNSTTGKLTCQDSTGVVPCVGTVVTTGSPTTGALVTISGATSIQSPSSTAVMDSSGNVSTPGSITTGSGGSAAGYLQLGQGTAPTAGTTAVTIYSSTSVTSYMMRLPAAAATGFYLGTNTSGDVVMSQVAANGSGNVLLSSGTAAIASGKTLTVNNSITITGTDSTTMTLPTTSKTLLANDFSNVSGTLPVVNMAASTLQSGTSVSLTAPKQYYICTNTCTVTPPVPANGYEFCVRNGNNTATVITLAALGSSARYENTANTAYGTAGTGTLVSGGAVGDKICIVGLDGTHYLTLSYVGTWTAN